MGSFPETYNDTKFCCFSSVSIDFCAEKKEKGDLRHLMRVTSWVIGLFVGFVLSLVGHLASIAPSHH